MKYSLDWLINIRKNELNSIEFELSKVNNKISENMEKQSDNDKLISNLKTSLYNCDVSWSVPSILRSIEEGENVEHKLNEELKYLFKEKDMILNRYNQKNIEIKLLNKGKDNFLLKEKEKKDKKEELEINELSLLTRKDA